MCSSVMACSYQKWSLKVCYVKKYTKNIEVNVKNVMVENNGTSLDLVSGYFTNFLSNSLIDYFLLLTSSFQ